MKSLDFIIVGAQKCATTTLHHYLAEHERIHLPQNKEAPFFNQKNYDAQGFNDFMAATYSVKQLNDGNLLGKASPQYMSGPCIPARIRKLNPDVKIVAVLRNPVQRALSHYRMAVKRGVETRSYDEAIQASLTHLSLRHGRTDPAPMHQKGFESEADFYVAWGEYGRILQNYREEFGSSNLLILFTEDMEGNPEGTLDQLLDFLGLNTGWRPQSLGQRFHKGGGVPRVSPERIKNLARIPVLGHCYRSLPEPVRLALRNGVSQWNLRADRTEHRLSLASKSRLNELYLQDMDLLRKMGVEAPWRQALEVA